MTQHAPCVYVSDPEVHWLKKGGGGSANMWKPLAAVSNKLTCSKSLRTRTHTRRRACVWDKEREGLYASDSDRYRENLKGYSRISLYDLYLQQL